MPPEPTQAAPAEARCVLVVEDDDGVRRSLELMLGGRGFRVRAYGAAEPLLADPLADVVALLVSDYRLPGMDGLAMIRALRERGWRGRAVLVTASMAPGLHDRALAAGFDVVLEKPMRPHALIAALEGAGDSG
ncbi:MAG: response regulator [Pseudomonadota bacterium]